MSTYNNFNAVRSEEIPDKLDVALAVVAHCTFIVTGIYQTGKQVPVLLVNGEEHVLELGMKIRLNNLVKTQDARVEIRDKVGGSIRLGQKSEFSVEITDEGINPVVYGSVYMERALSNPIMGGPNRKYRTSCFFSCSQSVYGIPSYGNTDIFYCLSEECTIWEYDENGRKFLIVHLDEGQKCTLEYRPGLPMRQRYVVQSVEQITDVEYDDITDNFINKKNWR